MPLLLLLIVAVFSGLAAAALARSRMRRSAVPPVAKTAQEVGQHTPRAAGWRAARVDPEKTTGLALTLALAVLFVGGVALAALAVIVRSTDLLAGLDLGLAEWADHHASAVSDAGLTLVTDLGETWTVILAAATVALVDRARMRTYRAVPFLLVVMLGDKLLTDALKHLIDRARPALEPVAATLGPSFPSGHTATAAASWAAFALIATRWCGRPAWPLLAGGAVGIAVGVALSRVFLDLHWLTDVLAGLTLGWAWFAICAIAFGGRLLRFGAAARIAGRAAAEAESHDVR